MSEAVQQQKTGDTVVGICAAFVGWAIPGFGHLVVKRWGKAAVYFLCVGGLACAGLAMRGGVFDASGTDIFDRLGYVADLSAGIFYFLAHNIQKAGPDIAHASGDYGTRMFATAGILNLLTVLEAFEIGSGRRN